MRFSSITQLMLYRASASSSSIELCLIAACKLQLLTFYEDKYNYNNYNNCGYYYYEITIATITFNNILLIITI